MGNRNPIRQGLAVAVILLFISVAFAPSINAEIKSNDLTCTNFLDDGTLSGYVYDNNMEPIEGALVRVYFHETYEEDYTDSSGYYHVTNIPICYCLKNATASKAGYTTEWVLLGIDENTTYDFVLTPSDGNILYVGGDGPGNYTSIQDAIDNASNGDIVFVFQGIYYESLKINKSITLLGEDRNTTIVSLVNFTSKVALYISSDYVHVHGFTFENSTGHTYCIILIDISFCEISGNIFSNNDGGGIAFNNCSHNKICGNIIRYNGDPHFLGYGIRILYDSYNNTIADNIIEDNIGVGIGIEYSSNNNIIGNIFRNNTNAIELKTSPKNNISYNKFYENEKGCIKISEFSNRNIIYRNHFDTQARSILLYYSILNSVLENNFMQRTILGCIYNEGGYLTKWNNNFWIHGRTFPKVILIQLIPWVLSIGVQFDWHPAQEPYDIP